MMMMFGRQAEDGDGVVWGVFESDAYILFSLLMDGWVHVDWINNQIFVLHLGYAGFFSPSRDVRHEGWDGRLIEIKFVDEKLKEFFKCIDREVNGMKMTLMMKFKLGVGGFEEWKGWDGAGGF
jgi:hypothetical protein